ncbi:MAG TPA: trypsin-like serine protease [Usitatibacter sp.]|nr:trypsin-like serine protease [Usitatibacter sp.]
MLKKLIAVVSSSAALFVPSFDAQAITAGGELDGNRHPYVGLMVAQDAKGNPLWRCSGTLIAPRLFLTAGHCTEAPAAHAEIWFDADVQSGVPQNGYPYEGQVGGKTYTHPQYDPNAFYLYDLGMVVLSDPVKMSTYGALPALDVLDRMATERGLQDMMFTAVGYGLQLINPVFVEQLKIRMYAEPQLLQINTGFTGDGSLLLSNNHSTGGTCFGDSGGPNFIGRSNVVGGVTSFGINGNCAGTGGVYRVDRADDLGWIYSAFGKLLR